MYICQCEAVTDHRIRGVAESGIDEFEELQAVTKVSTRCGKCKPEARDIFEKAVAERKRKAAENGESQS